MLSRLHEMERAGICSFKIEGRMKSAYYLATVINAYRRFMDGEDKDLCEKELLAVAHREYTQAYADGSNPQTVNYDDSQSKGEYVYIADVIKSEKGFTQAQMRNRFKVGDTLEVLSPTSNFKRTFLVEEVYNSKGERVEDCKLVQETYTLKCPYDLKKGDYLRRKVYYLVKEKL